MSTLYVKPFFHVLRSRSRAVVPAGAGHSNHTAEVYHSFFGNTSVFKRLGKILAVPGREKGTEAAPSPRCYAFCSSACLPSR